MFYDPRTGQHGLKRNPYKSLVVPRPIGWISTISKTGVANLGPYSFFNAVAENPHMVMFSSSYRPQSDLRKDSHWNAEETGEFVVNIVTEDLKDQMSASSASLPHDADEFKHAGLTPAPCRNVKAPRVKEAKVALECKHFQTVRLPAQPPNHGNVMVIGEVVGIHIDEAILSDGMVDMTKFRPVARLGYWQYTVVDNAFWMEPPP
ncbi:MAG: flavin reductase family protein [Alphaproteobacteria bacterium]|nr:flavin reductase family protein [Alphaproteobacteria bacterium]